MPSGIYKRTPEMKTGKHNNHTVNSGCFKKGYIVSEEYKKILSEKMKGRKVPPEIVAKVAASNTGKKRSEEFKKRMSILKKGKPSAMGMLGKKHSQQTIEKMKIIHGRGENNRHWKGGISRDTHSLKRPEYKEWRMKVFSRDKFKCKMFNTDCKGQLQAHHILRWADYPELRYEINNGITLCIAHHPRKIAEEKRLIPTFKELMSVSSE